MELIWIAIKFALIIFSSLKIVIDHIFVMSRIPYFYIYFFIGCAVCFILAVLFLVYFLNAIQTNFNLDPLNLNKSYIPLRYVCWYAIGV